MIIIGHRGAAGLAPENTLASFDKALQLGVDMVEFDVRLTKDKQLVILHDRHTKRVAFVKKHIRKMTLAEVKELVTKDGAPLLTLQELLAHLKQRSSINVELKSRGAAKYVAPVLAAERDKGLANTNLFVSSFHPWELWRLRRIDPALRLALLHRRFPFGFLLLAWPLQLYGAGFSFYITWPWLIRLANRMGLFTYVFTVNNQRSAELFARWGVDGVCTNRPDVVHAPRLKMAKAKNS